jgi:hypothetical protein
MSPLDVITLSIAIYAAIVASALWWIEANRDKKKISVIFEFQEFFNVTNLIIVNIAHRPIMISQISMQIRRNGDWEPVPRNAMFAEPGVDESFPIKISDGDSINFRINNKISEAYYINNKNIKINVFDIEGKIYSHLTSRIYNPKWGLYHNIKK